MGDDEAGRGFALRDVGLMLAGLSPAAHPRRLDVELSRNASARGNYNRVRMMLDRMGESDALRLYRRDPETGEYPVARWIDAGVLPDGRADPRYSFGSDATRKNHYSTLVMMSTRGKRCDELARRVDDEARAHFKARLAELAGSQRGGAPPPEGPPLAWADVLRAYADPAALARLDDSPADRLLVDWWLMGGDAFPPKRRHFGDVAVGRRPAKSAAPDRDTLVFDRRGGAVLRLAGGGEERLPPELAKAVRANLDAGGARWRRLLFPTRTGSARPASDNTFGQQVKAAFKRLTGRALGINALVKMYLTALESREDFSPEEKRAIRGRMMLGASATSSA